MEASAGALNAFALAMSAIVEAQITAAGMTAENEQRKHRGEAMAYTDSDFNSVAQNMIYQTRNFAGYIT